MSNGRSTAQWLVSIITDSQIYSDSSLIRVPKQCTIATRGYKCCWCASSVAQSPNLWYLLNHLQYLMPFAQPVWPCSRPSLSDTGEQAKLHWLQPSGYLTQPLATQWLTQRLIGVLKASYLTHQNNKYCYHAGSFSCLVSVPPKNASYLFPSACWFKPDSICPHSPCNKPFCFRCNPDRQKGCSWAAIGGVGVGDGGLTLVLLGKKEKK